MRVLHLYLGSTQQAGFSPISKCGLCEGQEQLTGAKQVRKCACAPTLLQAEVPGAAHGGAACEGIAQCTRNATMSRGFHACPYVTSCKPSTQTSHYARNTSPHFPPSCHAPRAYFCETLLLYACCTMLPSTPSPGCLRFDRPTHYFPVPCPLLTHCTHISGHLCCKLGIHCATTPNY
eukprot:1159639-Pelagomonas_calceolata.AAC.4